MHPLLERAGDSPPFMRASKIHRKLVQALDGIDITKSPFEIAWMGENVSYSAPLHRLGVVDYNDYDADLYVGVVLGDDENPVSSGEFYGIDSLDFAPMGMILIGFNRTKQDLAYSRGFKRQSQFLKLIGSKNWSSIEDIDVATLFSAMRSVFIHEYVHFYDFSVRKGARKMLAFGKKSLEKRGEEIDVTKSQREYFTSPVETNAYFHQAFSELVDLFEDMFVDKTKDDAKRFAPTSTKLWDRFVRELEPGIVSYVSNDKLLKLYAARLTDAWEKYVSKL